MTEPGAGGMRPQAKGHQSHQKPEGTKKDTSILGLFFFFFYCFQPPSVCYALCYALPISKLTQHSSSSWPAVSDGRDPLAQSFLGGNLLLLG